jgi:LacI family transcriptional regulator
LEIGFYGATAIRSRIAASRVSYRFGFLLHQPSRPFYQSLAKALETAAEQKDDCRIEPRVEFLDDLSPENTASRMLALGENCDAVGVVAAVHPLVTQAIAELSSKGKPVFALISQLAAYGQVHYVGLDNWEVGRTAAWAFEHICEGPGKLGILLGNPRYQCQEMNEAGFRSYTLLEPLSTFETRAVAQEMTEKLIREHPDLVGLFISGGGISGAIAGLRSTGMAGRIVAVGYEMIDVTRTALLDGTLTFLIAHPLKRLADETIAGMVQAVSSAGQSGAFTTVLPFDIFTRENLRVFDGVASGTARKRSSPDEAQSHDYRHRGRKPRFCDDPGDRRDESGRCVLHPRQRS